MKRNLIQMACLAGLIAACSPKQSVVSVPPSQIDVEQLRDSIDYAMDVIGIRTPTVGCYKLADALCQRRAQI